MSSLLPRIDSIDAPPAPFRPVSHKARHGWLAPVNHGYSCIMLAAVTTAGCSGPHHEAATVPAARTTTMVDTTHWISSLEITRGCISGPVLPRPRPPLKPPRPLKPPWPPKPPPPPRPPICPYPPAGHASVPVSAAVYTTDLAVATGPADTALCWVLSIFFVISAAAAPLLICLYLPNCAASHQAVMSLHTAPRSRLLCTQGPVSPGQMTAQQAGDPVTHM